MSRQVFSPAEVEGLAFHLMQSGLHPSVVRRRLAEQGVYWSYGFINMNGRRERVRRLKQHGFDLCGCGFAKPIGALLCTACLNKKWEE